MAQFYHGKLLTTPMGPAGPDGNPIGTILSFLGLTPPKDYLVCDGSVLNIEDYPDLANFFNTQFGTKNHFGGDGDTTFALPDMRNLFLRGWHGEAEEQLSGNVGAKQEGTEFPYIAGQNAMAWASNGTFKLKQLNEDSVSEQTSSLNGTGHDTSDPVILPTHYTSRPVNTAVLYCIKAIESIGYDANDYSLEEKRIGTWIDGKPLYRRVILENSGDFTQPDEHLICSISEQIDTLIKLDCVLFKDGSTYFFPISQSGARSAMLYCHLNKHIYVTYSTALNYLSNNPIEITIEYTKTTD